MRSFKVHGPDNILLKFQGYGSSLLRNCLVLFILKMWETKTLPNDFHYTTNITFFKKGNRENCSWRIPLMIIAYYHLQVRKTWRIRSGHAMTIVTKIMVFEALVLFKLLYVCETWILYRSDMNNLEHFQKWKLRKILKIPWESHMINLKVFNRSQWPALMLLSSITAYAGQDTYKE